MSLASIDSEAILSGTMTAKSVRGVPQRAAIEAYQLSESGLSHSEVAAIQETKIQTVRDRIAVVEKFLASGVAVEVSAIKTQQHLRLEALYKASMEAFRRTMGTERTVRKKLNPDGSVAEETVTEIEKAGDPRFINSAMKALEAQRDIWPGVAAPKATALTNSDGTEDAKVTVEVLERCEMDELEALVAAANIIDARKSDSNVGED